MKGTLLKIEAKVVDLPYDRPYYRELVRDRLSPIAWKDGEFPADSAMMTDVKTIDYRLVQVAGGKNGENGTYLVNDDMWYTAVPILNDLVESKLTKLKNENRDQSITIGIQQAKIRRYESTWWIKLKNRLNKSWRSNV